MKWDLTDPPQFASVDGDLRSAQSLQLQLSAVRHSEMQTASGYLWHWFCMRPRRAHRPPDQALSRSR